MIFNRTHILTVAILAALLVANVIVTHNIFTAPFPGLNDYLTPWEGARTFFYEGYSPYGEEATLRIQTRIYGRAATPDEFPNYFAYPMYTVLVMAPFISFDYAWATAIWLVLMEAAMVASALLILAIFRWRPSPLMLMALLLFTLFYYPTARGLILGQVSHLVFLLQMLTLWLLSRDDEVLPGVLLAISTFKPHVGVLLVPFLLLWGLRTGRLRFVAAFSGTFAALLAASFLMLPDWVDGWLYQLELYPSYVVVGAPVAIIREALGLGAWFEIGATVLLLGGTLLAWADVLLRNNHRSFWWTVTLTFVVTHLVIFRTATPHFVVFLIPFFFIFAQIARVYRKRGANWRIVALMMLLFVLPWVHFVTTIEGDFEHPFVHLPLPLLTLALLLATRRLWLEHAPTMPRRTSHTDAASTDDTMGSMVQGHP